MATMDDLIEEILAEYEPRPILDEPIPEAEERLSPRPLRSQWPFTDLDDRVPHPVRLPAYEPWVEILNDAKDEFEVDGAAAVKTTRLALWQRKGTAGSQPQPPPRHREGLREARPRRPLELDGL